MDSSIGDLGKGLKHVPIGVRASAAGVIAVGASAIFRFSVPINADAFAVHMGFAPPSSFPAGSVLGGRSHHGSLDLVPSVFEDERIGAFRRILQMEKFGSDNRVHGREDIRYSLGFAPMCSVMFRSELRSCTQHGCPDLVTFVFNKVRIVVFRQSFQTEHVADGVGTVSYIGSSSFLVVGGGSGSDSLRSWWSSYHVGLFDTWHPNLHFKFPLKIA